MPRKKVVKQPIEKMKDEEIVLEIIEDTSSEDEAEGTTEADDQENAITVSKGGEVISQMSVADIKEELPKPEKKKRTMTDEQKAKMKAGRERKKAERALQAGKQPAPPPAEPKVEPSPPPAEAEGTTEDMPGWFKSYLSSQKKPEPEPVVKKPKAMKPKALPKDDEPAPKPKRGRPPKLKVPETPAPTKPSMRFI